MLIVCLCAASPSCGNEVAACYCNPCSGECWYNRILSRSKTEASRWSFLVQEARTSVVLDPFLFIPGLWWCYCDARHFYWCTVNLCPLMRYTHTCSSSFNSFCAHFAECVWIGFILLVLGTSLSMEFILEYLKSVIPVPINWDHIPQTIQTAKRNPFSSKYSYWTCIGSLRIN